MRITKKWLKEQCCTGYTDEGLSKFNKEVKNKEIGLSDYDIRVAICFFSYGFNHSDMAYDYAERVEKLSKIFNF